MAFTLNFGGSVNNTNASTSYPNNFVYTNGYSFPSGNASLEGDTPVKINSLSGVVLAPSPSGLYYRIVRGSTLFATGNIVVDSGGTFQFRIGYSSGTLKFGRNDATGPGVIDFQDGGSWSGQLVGTMTWSTVPALVSATAVSRSGRNVTVNWATPSSNGGATITGYSIQYTTNNGLTWGSTVNTVAATLDHTYTNLTPGLTYRFRVWAKNDVGNGNDRETSNVLVPAGGKRYDGTSWINTSTARRYNGSQWIDLSTARRYNGSQWVELS